MVKPIVPIPYLPDILKTIVQRVNVELAKLDTPIILYFDYGLVSQVSRSVAENPNNFPLLWLVFNFDENVGYNPGEFLNTTVQLVIMNKTDNTWTSQERDNNNFHPILFPIYQELVNQIRKAVEFGKPSESATAHKRTNRPYWGGGDVNGADTENLFKQFVDAVHIRDLNLKISKQC